MKIWAKFCGITSIEDADSAASLRPDALGFVFFKKSPRFITLQKASRIIRNIPSSIDTVGVFVNEDLAFIKECAEKCSLRAVQLHGDEDTEYCQRFKDLGLKNVKTIKAIRVKDKKSLGSIERFPVDAVLLDAYSDDLYGGTGKRFNSDLALEAKKYGKPIIISGGLDPENVYDVITKVRPYGVDVSSGIESGPGKKDLDLMQKFMKEIRRAEGNT